MKLKMTVFILSILLILVSCAGQKQFQDKTDWDGYEVRIYEVFGMDCPGCHGGLEKLVNKIPEVHDCVANWEKSELRVAVRKGSTLDDAAVIDAIQRANFTPGKKLN